MDVIILAGGAGTRLRAVVPDKQKVVAPVRGRPFLAYVLAALAAAGPRRVILALGWRAEQVLEELRALNIPGLEIVGSTEDSPLGTGGATRLAFQHVEGERAVVMNGDSWIRVPVPALEATHHRSGALVTMVVTLVPSVARFGAVRLIGDCLVSGFMEKGTDGAGYINAGTYVLDRAAVQRLPLQGPSSLEHDLFPSLVSDASLRGYIADGPFIDIGTAESFAQADDFFTTLGVS